MKYVRFRDPAGAVRRGVLDGDTNDDIDSATITFGTDQYTVDEIDVLPPSEPSKIVCIGRNYAAHAAEFDSELPDRPLLFLKGPNTLAAYGDTVTLPSGKDRIDYEAELGVVIGEQCRHVSKSNATEVIGGYTCVNDLSNRDDQEKEQNWIRGKAFDGAAPIGPVLATADELPADAFVRSYVNGELKQDGTIEHLAFSIPELIAEITTYITLEPGDVIATGTPEGVGPLADGDTVEISVEGVGTLKHDVRIP